MAKLANLEMMILISQRYSYLACGPRVACRVCGKTATAQVKECGIPATLWRTAGRVVVALRCMRTPLMTTVFEALSNPFFRNLTKKNREQYEKNRKKVVHWLLAGWPETQERLRTNNLIAGGAWANKRHLAYLKRQFPELLHVTAELVA